MLKLVSKTSDEVIPWCRYLAFIPAFSVTEVRKAITSCLTSASILSNGNTYSASISQIETSDALASKIQLFTRDGRHVSGTSLNATQIASLIKTEKI